MPRRKLRYWWTIGLVVCVIGLIGVFNAMSSGEGDSEEATPLFAVRTAGATDLQAVGVVESYVQDVALLEDGYECSLQGTCEDIEVHVLVTELPGCITLQDTCDCDTQIGPTCMGFPTCSSTCLPTCGVTCIETCGSTCLTCSTCDTCWNTCEATCASCDPPCPMSTGFGW